MQYKVVSKIQVEGEDAADREYICRRLGIETEFVSYKVIAGLYIFYITQEVYELGVQSGWIQPMVKEVPIEYFDGMLNMRGIVCYHRMKTALELSTPEYLRQCLEKIEKLPKTVRIRINQVRWHGKKSVLTPLSEVYLNTVSGIVSGKHRFKESDLFDPLLHVENHENLLDTLAGLLDRRFMNSRDIYEQFARNDFYDFDYICLSRSYKVDFEFIE